MRQTKAQRAAVHRTQAEAEHPIHWAQAEHPDPSDAARPAVYPSHPEQAVRPSAQRAAAHQTQVAEHSARWAGEPFPAAVQARPVQAERTASSSPSWRQTLCDSQALRPEHPRTLDPNPRPSALERTAYRAAEPCRAEPFPWGPCRAEPFHPVQAAARPCLADAVHRAAEPYRAARAEAEPFQAEAEPCREVREAGPCRAARAARLCPSSSCPCVRQERSEMREH
jgi:hypothetical protein